MGINRRRGNRRNFKFNKNYIIPFACIVVTCITIIVSTSIILNLKKQIPIHQTNGQIINTEGIQLTDNEKTQINDMFSFLMSNTDIGQELSDDNIRYLVTCKYFARNNSFKIVENQYIDNISPDIYRNLGYVFFEDYKDTYMYINKKEYINTYKQLFNIEKLDENKYTKYYIPQIEGYVVPKNNNIYDNSRYKVREIEYNKENDTYTAVLLEINVLKLYEQKVYIEVLSYLANTQIDNNYLTGKMFKIKLKKIDNIFVFDGYTL